MNNIKLSIVIVSYNTASLLKKCLETIDKALDFADLTKQGEVIVVDNASTDNSCGMVRKNFPQVYLLHNKRNLGFAKANNQGIQKSKGKYVLLLNTDTELSTRSLKVLLREAESDKKTGVVGGKLLNRDGSLQPSAGFFPELFRVFLWMSFIDDLPIIKSIVKPYHVENPGFYEKEEYCDWVSGACLLLKKQVFEQIGGLDENLFMYGEEVEWCYRVKRSGYQIVYTPESTVYHYKGQSSEKKYDAGIVDEFKAILYFYKKHKTIWEMLLLRLFLFYGALLRIVLFGIIGIYPKRIKLYAEALYMVRR